MAKKVLLGFVIFIIVVGLFIGVSVIGTYNRLVALNEQVGSSWAQVETVLQRRFDLFPPRITQTGRTRNGERAGLRVRGWF